MMEHVNNISIKLFHSKDSILHAVERELYKKPTVLIVWDTTSHKLSHLKDGHKFGLSTRRLAQSINGLGGREDPYRVLALHDIQQIREALTATGIRIMVYEKKVIQQLGMVPTPIRILTTWCEFSGLKATASPFLRPAFNLSQFPAFEEAFKT
jgi:hypothetical protein